MRVCYSAQFIGGDYIYTVQHGDVPQSRSVKRRVCNIHGLNCSYNLRWVNSTETPRCVPCENERSPENEQTNSNLIELRLLNGRREKAILGVKRVPPSSHLLRNCNYIQEIQL